MLIQDLLLNTQTSSGSMRGRLITIADTIIPASKEAKEESRRKIPTEHPIIT